MDEGETRCLELLFSVHGMVQKSTSQMAPPFRCISGVQLYPTITQSSVDEVDWLCVGLLFKWKLLLILLQLYQNLADLFSYIQGYQNQQFVSIVPVQKKGEGVIAHNNAYTLQSKLIKY